MGFLTIQHPFDLVYLSNHFQILSFVEMALNGF